jgi:hemerythrin-like domain-containing protein
MPPGQRLLLPDHELIRMTRGRDQSMARIIEILLEEHRNIDKLLLVLAQELEVFDRSEVPDYEILRAVIEYFEDYPESCHHPKEDLVFEKLKLRDPAEANRVGDAEAEHQIETNRLRRFSQAVEDILAGREFLRQIFHNVAHDFIKHQRQHMEKEERLLFPAAAKALRPEDWAQIDARLNDRKDPLFDGSVENKFHALQRTILQWKQEAETNRVDAIRVQN